MRDREGARRAARRAERRAAWRAFGGCLAFRAANALLVRTAFVPDEYWQSLEVAHDLVFGYGHRTWEWAPETALRSFAHPVLFANEPGLSSGSSPLFEVPTYPGGAAPDPVTLNAPPGDCKAQ